MSSLFDYPFDVKVTIRAQTFHLRFFDFHPCANRAKIKLSNYPCGGRNMPRRKRVNKQQPKKQINWTTTIWYIIGALIVLAMVFSLVAGAFR